MENDYLTNLPKIHPRVFEFQGIRDDFLTKLQEFRKMHNVTSAEWVGLLSEEMSRFTHHLIQQERKED